MQPQPQARAITLQDIMNMPGLFLGISALIVLIVGASQQNVITILIALIMGASAVIAFGFVASPLLRGIVPVLSISSVFGFILLVSALWAAAQGGGGQWQTWLTLIAGLIALFAAFRAIVLKKY